MEEKTSCVVFTFQGKEYMCSLELTMDIIGGKWKPIMIYHLRKGSMRSSELMRKLNGISNKMFTQTARELERVGIIEPRSILLYLHEWNIALPNWANPRCLLF